MDSDLSEFYDEFFDESLEHIENIESILINVEGNNLSSDDMDAIFRGVHSIKGGCGMFDFTHLANFSHNLETLMDEIRQGKRHATEGTVDLLIQSNDAIKSSVDALRVGDDSEQPLASELNHKIQEILKTPDGADDSIEDLPNKSEENNHIEEDKNLEEVEEVIVDTSEENILEDDDVSAEVVLKSGQSEEQQFNSAEGTEEEIIVSNSEVGDNPDENSQIEIKEQVNKNHHLLPDEIAPQDLPLKNKPVNAVNAKKPSSDSIRILTHKIDSIINQVGELVITKSMLAQRYSKIREDGETTMEQSLLQLEHNVRELQESIMDLRMVPVDSIFKRFHRLVRDLSRQTGKDIELEIEGAQTEIDKNMVEKLSDPLVHLMRNAIDHGIETKEQREKTTKPKVGTIQLKAYHKGGAIMIDIIDDGRGIDTDIIFKKSVDKGLLSPSEQLSKAEILELIFEPGFSTAETISDISGRGVGMDVVRRNIQTLGGSIEITSDIGVGSCFSIRLPLTLSIIDGQLFRIDNQIYIIPMTSIIELIQVEKQKIKLIAGKSNEVHKLRDHYIPIIRLNEVMGSPDSDGDRDLNNDGLLIVVETKKKKVGLFVHELLSQQQVVMKSLEDNFRRVMGIPAATILGDGRVALIVDVDGLYELSTKMNGKDKCSNDPGFLNERLTNVK